MKSKIINKVDFITKIVLIITMLLSTIFVGSPIKENASIIRIILISIAIIFVILHKILEADYKIINNKLDIFVFILALAPTIPIIFKTYVSFNDSMVYALRYISVLGLYIVTKQLAINKKLKKNIIHTIIASSIIIAFIGIDDLTTRFLYNFLQKINNVDIWNQEVRMFGNFGYPNTFAIYIAVGILFTIFEYMKNLENNKKYLYTIILTILLPCLILSYSRAVIALFLLTIFIYFILLKNKEKRYNLFKIMIVCGLEAVVFTKIFSNTLLNKQYIIIWMAIIVLAILACIIIKFTRKIDKFILKQKNTILIGTIVILIIVFVIFILVGMNLKEEFTIFTNSNQESQIEHRILNIEKGKEYNFVFDLEANSLLEYENTYSITIIEEDKFANEIQQEKILFNNIKDKKEIKIKATDEAYLFVIRFNNIYPKLNQGLTVKTLYVNEEEIVLKYKYLPAKLVNKIKSFKITDDNLKTRTDFVKAAVELSKENWLLGIGGGGYQYEYVNVAQYRYNTKEIHCYPMQVLLEFGIVGIIGLAGIVIIILKMSKKENIDVILAISLIFIHSLMDFEFSFMAILVLFFVLIAILENKHKTNNKIKIDNIIATIILLVLGLSLYASINEKQYNKQNIYKQTRQYSEEIEDVNELINNIEYMNKKEPFFEYENMLFLQYILVEEKLEDLSKEDLKLIYAYYEKDYDKLNMDLLLIKNNYILGIAEKLQKSKKEIELQKSFLEIILKNKEQKQEILNNNEKTTKTKEQTQKIKNIWEEQIKKAKNIYGNL